VRSSFGAGDPALPILQLIDAAAFLLIAMLAVRDWWRERERRRGYLALALGALGLVAVGWEVLLILGPWAWLTTLVILLFMASGAALLVYRDSILSLPVRIRVLAGAGLVAVTVAGLAAGLPSATLAGGLTEPQVGAAVALFLAWSLTVIEPAYRLARLSGTLPPVQRARVQSLAVGYLGLVGVATLTLTAVSLGGTQLSLGLQVGALLCVPPLYLGLAAPRWLRWVWRRSEEAALHRAIHDVLLATPDRETVARRSLGWAVRLVGASAGLVADSDGRLLAVQGMFDQDARDLHDQVRAAPGARLLHVGPAARTALVERLPVETGSGLLVVVSGTLSPAFGADEVEWLSAFAASMAIALDRARVAELTLLNEARLRRAKELAESANQAKSEFLSRMSHELRTPLTAVIGFADLLLADEPDEQRARHLATILKAGEHLLGLINEVLDISRIEEGRLALSLEPVLLAETVSEAVDLIRPAAQQRSVSLRVEAPPAGLCVRADHRRLKQVLVNLLSNAVKYNRGGGWVELRSSVSEGWIRVEVQDSGPGLGGEDLERLFSPFERLSASGSGVEGTGLGLALSKALTEAMGAQIGVDSAVGSGSTFWIELPMAEAEELEADVEATGRGREVAAQLPPSLLLYVEDALSNLSLVEGLVARRPELSLVSARDGRRALELARDHHPDLILLDAHLPDMDGVEVLTRLRADPLTADVPVVALSADDTRPQIDRFLEAGAREYLTKPIRVAALLQALERHVRGEAAAPARPP
jgi:signal transduction histidine kinase/ActR/RegA family two-component response regulator